MRNYLHRLAQIIAAPFLGNNLLVDPASRQVVIPRQLRMRKPLVVSKIQIRLSAVIGDKHLSMLERAHRARIDIQIGIELHQVDAQTARLQQAADRRGRQTFA